MNIHPIIVHFPVALLCVYSLLELLRFKLLLKSNSWFYLKAFILLLGTLCAHLTLATGEVAEHLYLLTHPDMERVVEIHSMWAATTVATFSLLSVIYAVKSVRKKGYESKIIALTFVGLLWRIVARVVGVLDRPMVMVLLALIGLLAITVTGSLGGFIVYGAEGVQTDPFIYFASKLVQ